MSKWLLPRRTFLRGAGASILLPALDAMIPSRAHAQAMAPPPRYIAFFLSLGSYGLGYDPTQNDANRYPAINPWDPGGLGVWAPKNNGPFTEALPPALSALEPLKQKLSVLTGLGTLVEDARGTPINHSCATTAFATSAWRSSAAAAAANISNGATTATDNVPPDSFDQYIANALNLTPGSTLALSPAANADYSELQMGGHGGAISYNSKLAATGSTLVPRVSDPTAAFNTLFGTCASNNAATAARQSSILDYVKGAIPQVQRRLGTQDKARLDSYLQNIRDLEVKLQSQLACPSTPTADPPLSGGPVDAVSTLNMLVDVAALAVSSNAMPIATLMTTDEASAIAGQSASAAVAYVSTYVGINGQRVTYHSANLDTHNDITHVETGNAQAIEEHIAYTQLGISFVARLLSKLDGMPAEPNGLTPLDNTLVLAGAAHSNPCFHTTHNLPLLVAGGKRYGMTQGQTLAFPMVTDLGDLYFTMARAMGLAGASFNGRSGVLPGLFSSM